MSEQIIEKPKQDVVATPALDSGVGDELFGGLQEAVNTPEPTGEPSHEDVFKDDGKTEPEKVEEAVQEEVAEEKPKLNINVEPEQKSAESEWGDNLKVPRASDDWKKYREVHNSTVNENKALKAELEQLRSKSTELQQLDELRQKVSEYEQQSKAQSLLNDPNLTREIDNRMSSVVNSAKASLDEQQAKDFESIARMEPGKHRDRVLSEFADDLSPIKQAQVAAYMARVDELRSERNSMIEYAKSNADELYKQREAAMTKQREAAVSQQNAVFDSVAKEMRQLPGCRDVFGDGAQAKPWIDAAKNVYSGNVGSPKDLAMKAIMAETAPALIEHAIEVSKMLVDRDAKIKDLEDELKSFKDSSHAPRTASGSRSIDSNDDFLAGAARAFGQT